ncbi:MAG: hypothetical protein WCC32_16920 [Terriglobales bacterium]
MRRVPGPGQTALSNLLAIKSAEYLGTSAVDTREVAHDLRLSRAYRSLCDLTIFSARAGLAKSRGGVVADAAQRGPRELAYAGSATFPIG